MHLSPLSPTFAALFSDCRRRKPAIFLTGLFLLLSQAHGVTLLSTGDAAANTSEPGGALAGSGWNYEGDFGAFLGTAIGPHHFVTVKHIGIASDTFVYRGSNYSIVRWFDDPYTELRIFEVVETLPDYAPLYTSSGELGQKVLMIGRGTQRGDPVYLAGTLRGWLWGPSDGVRRWGENQIDEAPEYSLWTNFDETGIANEAQLSSGDSGGAFFLKDNGVWKLAGISFAADGPTWTTATGGEFAAALFDRRGFYETSGLLISGAAPIPCHSIAVRISSRVAWIQSVLSPGAPMPTPTPTPSVAPLAANVPQILTPVPGSTLPSSTVTFKWSSGGASRFRLCVGNAPGASDIYNSAKLGVRSLRVNNIPTNGATIHVRLSWQVKRQWKFSDYTFHAY